MSASTEMEAAAQAATPEAGILDQTIDSFIETMDGFLSELRVVWPGCMALKRLRLEFDVAITHAFSEEARSMAKRKVVRMEQRAVPVLRAVRQTRCDHLLRVRR